MKKNFFPTQKRFIVALVFLCVQCTLQAQPLKQFSSHTFSVNEGLLANRIVDIAEDNAGFVWVSFGAGLQRFNGNEFEAVLPQQGLPETNHPHFFKLHNGNLWLSYHSGISAYNSITNKFEVIYETPERDLKNMHLPEPYQVSPVMPVLETANAVWCWSTPQHQFIAIDKSTHKVAGTFNITGKLPGVKYFKRSSSGTLLVSFDQGIAEIDFTTKKIVHLYHIPGIIKLVYDFFSLKKDTLLLATNKEILILSVHHPIQKFAGISIENIQLIIDSNCKKIIV